jgi:Uncharacterized protein conserved in bacteria (DUF2188)
MTRLLVVPSSQGGWEVKDGGGTPLSHHSSPQEAEQAALELLSRSGEEGEVIMQGRPAPAHPKAA